MKSIQITLLALGLMIIGCNPQTIATTMPITVTTDVVKRQDLTGYSFFDGKLLIPETARATAFSPYDTPIVSVGTSEGRHVTRGEQIVRLTIPGADAASAAAKSNVNSANENYSAEKSGNSGPVVEAKRALEEARTAEKAARDTIANGGEADLESATRTRIDAESVLRAAQEELRRSLQPSKEAVQNAALALKISKDDAAKGIVRAPISGTVVSLDAQPGMVVTFKQPLATIINFDAVRVQGLVPAELKDFVIKDVRVIIAINGDNSDPLDGKVVDISVVPPSEGQTSPGYLAVIRILNPKGMGQPGVSVKRIGVKTGTVKQVLVVPVSAIVEKEGKSYVNVQQGENWIETLVEVGISDGALSEIKSGLTQGAVVRIISAPESVQGL